MKHAVYAQLYQQSERGGGKVEVRNGVSDGALCG